MSKRNRSSRVRRVARRAAATPADGRAAGVPLAWLVAAIALAIVFTAGGSYFLFGGDSTPTTASSRYPSGDGRSARPVEPRPATGTLPVVAATPTGEVSIPLADLNDGRARWVDYTPQGEGTGAPIRIFALLDNGTYRAALDACEECFYAKQGYFQRDGEMVCRKCGNSYPAVMIDRRAGGCHPVALPRRAEGDDLVIAAADIDRAQASLLNPAVRELGGATTGSELPSNDLFGKDATNVGPARTR